MVKFLFLQHVMSLKEMIWVGGGGKDGSVVKGACSSSRGPEFISLQGGS